ncbi:hypothetical protein ASPZODRAFT_1402536 [Penicilliopsis zonata CBS 506.65]|uniref:Leucine rich repeat protein n=1 Tax=Penicilliopsis zonata CBS 506.65 TaxID=1073090 RepID=A0A1L9SPU8_9EURO|nr:hypothetical protein ASPZODRAFT_1402536 [Penicilliopsis zonata CBS 506.65]OJJ49131.1 hypothetical protein ASPZODRAFT_1402536 [Penicilliopsis zonata CBS 506.65]
MGKLNYSARKIEGVKAGQVLSKDLRKRITPGVASRAAARDPSLEIDMTGRELTDEGFQQFINDLLECLYYRDEEHPEGAAKLTELHLPFNRLSIASVALLAEVIVLCAGDLRELDLSNNRIEVASETDKRVWQAFLESFKECYMLKKIDLGHNPLGLAGVEILARVYMQSDLDFVTEDDVVEESVVLRENAVQQAYEASPVDDLAGKMATLSLKAAGKENIPPEKATPSRTKGSVGRKTPRQASRTQSVAPIGKAAASQDEMKRYASMRGLRSVPYIILSGIPLTSGGVVHLTSMVRMHRAPEQLLGFLPGGKTVSLPNTSSERCRGGIIWWPNPDLSQHAQKLLSVTETLRDPQSDGEETDEESGYDSTSATTPHKADDPLAQRSLQKKRDLEYLRLNKRIRIDALKTDGVHSAEIWNTALKMMVVSRALLLEDRHRPGEAQPAGNDENGTKLESNTQKDQQIQQETDVQLQPVPDESVNASQEVKEKKVADVPGSMPHAFMTIPNHYSLNSIFRPGWSAFDTHFPALGAPQTRETSVTPSPAAASKEKPKKAEKVEKPSPSHAPIPRTGKIQVPQKKHWRSGLPVELWRRIIADALGADGVLDHEQQMNIVLYAADWNAIAYELTIKGFEEHQQIWKFLDTVNCFAYRPN